MNQKLFTWTLVSLMHNTVRYTLRINLLIPERRELSSVLCCGKSYQTLSHDRDQRPERPGKQGPAWKTHRTNIYCLLSLCSTVSSGEWPMETVIACAPHLSSLFLSHSLPLPSPLSFSPCFYPPFCPSHSLSLILSLLSLIVYIFSFNTCPLLVFPYVWMQVPENRQQDSQGLC